MNPFIIISLILILIFGIIAISIYTTRACINLRNKEKVFMSVKNLREVLQLEIDTFKDFILWLLNINGYTILEGKVIGEYEVMVSALKDKKKQNIIIYKRAPNHFIHQSELSDFKEKYMKTGDFGIIITTSDFDEDVKQNNRSDTSINLISSLELQKMIEKKRAEDPF